MPYYTRTPKRTIILIATHIAAWKKWLLHKQSVAEGGMSTKPLEAVKVHGFARSLGSQRPRERMNLKASAESENCRS